MSKHPDLERSDPFTPKDADAAVFDNGAAGLVDERVVAKPIRIFDIVPDPRQPRRAMPSVIRGEPVPAAINGDGDEMTWRLNFWARRVYIEVNGVAPSKVEIAWQSYQAMIEGKDVYRAEKPGIAELALLAVAELAASIKRDGLTNPITVSQQKPGQYVIETGERRWLAYHLLHHLYGGGWDKIPARVQEKADVWKQASENNQRSDLNAIGKARQFAILLMDLLAADVEFKSYDECDSDQDYYAQVADAKLYRVPSGKADMLLNAMGMKARQSLNDYRTLLKLPEEFWIQGDDENWSRDVLLQIVSGADNLDDKTLTPQPPLPHGEGEEDDADADYSGADLSQVDISQVDEFAPALSPMVGLTPEIHGEWSNGTVAVAEKPASPAPPPAEHIPNGGKIRLTKGVAVWTKAGRQGVIDQVVNANLVVVDFGGNRKPMQISDLLTTPPPNPLPINREGEKEAPKLVEGDWVRHTSGQVGQVVRARHAAILVRTQNGEREWGRGHVTQIDDPSPQPPPQSVREGEKNGTAREVALGELPWQVLEIEKHALWVIEDHGGKRLAKLNSGVIATWVVDMANLMGSEEVQGALRVLRYAFDRTLEEETGAADLVNDIDNLRGILNEIEPEIKHLVDYPGSEND